ncbi:L10-interacting MYB domain-containing protein-like [Aristolochia californica]|uniref:L10-interacting MYB domain-containing protein-like n=1 Tax=Aristolochia californica TaxID=171875 RepID=UPI0035E009DD
MGNKLPNEVWKHEVSMVCVNMFDEDTVNKKTCEQLKNRTRSWKKSYQIVTRCLNTSGFGWDATTHRVTACHFVWQDYIKENRDAEKYRREGCLLYEKLALLEDVNVGRDTPSPFLIENESAPEQSQRGNPSSSTRHRKRPEMSTDDTGRFIDAMKDIIETFRDTITSKDGNANSDLVRSPPVNPGPTDRVEVSRS